MDSDRTVLIRAAQSADLLALLRLYSRADEGRHPVVTSASSLEESTWQQMLATPNLKVYVAEKEDTLVGTALFQTMPNLGYSCRPSGSIDGV